MPNRHVACQWDELYRLLCDGLAVKRLRLRPKGEPPRELTLEVSVWSGRWRFPPGLGVGSRAAYVERLLGRPSERTGKHLRFRDPEGYQASVTFALRAGRLTWIRWDIPVDRAIRQEAARSFFQVFFQPGVEFLIEKAAVLGARDPVIGLLEDDQPAGDA